MKKSRLSTDGSLARGKNIFRILLFNLLFCVGCVFSFAASGTLDTTFSGYISNAAGLNDVAVQPDGKILVSGNLAARVNNTTKYDFVRLNSDGSFDSTFNAVISYTSGTTDYYVDKIIVQPDGKILITVNYTSASAGTGRVLRLNQDGSRDTSFVFGSGAVITNDYAYVNEFALQADGKILVGGKFAFYNGSSRSGLARLNADGSVDTTFTIGTGVGSSRSVDALAVQADGKVLVGGGFDSFNGQARNGIVRLNTNGSVDTSFNSGGAGLSANGYAFALTVQSDGKILIGGNFTSYNGASRNSIARLNSDGTLDTAFNVGSGITYSQGGSARDVREIKLQDGRILIGGYFELYNGTPRDGIARVNTDGSLDTTFNPQYVRGVQAIAIQSDGKLLFDILPFLLNGVSRSTLGRFNTDGSLDTSFTTVMQSYNSETYGLALAVQPDGKVLVSGDVDMELANGSNGSFVRPGLARFNEDGSVDTAFVSLFDAREYPENPALALQSDGKIIVGGGFETYAGVSRNGIVRINADGSLDTTFNVGSAFSDGSVSAIIIQPDGRILIAGGFSIYNGTPRKSLLRLNPDGSLDTSFNVGTGAGCVGQFCGSSVDEISLQPNGKIIIGGSFTIFNGVTQNHLARLNADGSLDTSFNIGTGFNGENNSAYIDGLALQPDGKILVGGEFTSYNGAAISGIVRINPNGSRDTSFTSGFSAGDFPDVKAITLQATGKIIIGGRFSIYGGVSRNNIARINADGSLDTAFNPGTGANDDVEAIALAPNEKIYIAGRFTLYNGTARSALARIFANSSAKTAFDFDGDGKSDVSVFRPTESAWYISGSLSGFIGSRFGIASDKPAPADYDGDGKTDIAVFRPSEGNWYIQRSRDGYYGTHFGSSEDIPAPADYDGDGRAEIAVYRPSEGSWYIFNLTNNAVTGARFGLAEDKPVAADYDGDGKTDIAVFRPSEGNWYIQRSRDGFFGIKWGIPTDKPVVGDYDGDGKADQAVYRASEGNWYILKSRDGFTGIHFGISTDLPVAADYDGDGKTDIAVFRPADGDWYLLKSKDGLGSLHFGSNGDKPTPNAFVP